MGWAAGEGTGGAGGLADRLPSFVRASRRRSYKGKPKSIAKMEPQMGDKTRWLRSFGDPYRIVSG
jgi:hypothetical protein